MPRLAVRDAGAADVRVPDAGGACDAAVGGGAADGAVVGVRDGWGGGMRCGDILCAGPGRDGEGFLAPIMGWALSDASSGFPHPCSTRRKRETETVLGRRSKKPSWGVRWGPLRQIWVEEEEWAAGAVISEARW